MLSNKHSQHHHVEQQTFDIHRSTASKIKNCHLKLDGSFLFSNFFPTTEVKISRFFFFSANMSSVVVEIVFQLYVVTMQIKKCMNDVNVRVNLGIKIWWNISSKSPWLSSFIFLLFISSSLSSSTSSLLSSSAFLFFEDLSAFDWEINLQLIQFHIQIKRAY